MTTTHYCTMIFRPALVAVCSFSAAISVASTITPLSPDDLLVNGGFEVFDQGAPVGWDYLRTDGPANLASTNVSPWGSGNYSVLITDSGTQYSPRLTQEFAPFYGQVDFSFDFQLVGSPFNREPSWHIYTVADSGSVPLGIAFVSTGATHQISISRRFSDIRLTLIPDQWYHLQIAFDLANRRHSGSLITESDIVYTWTDSEFSNTAADNIARLEIADYFVERSNSIYFDNFSLRPVPEPSSLLLLLAPVVLLFAGKRRVCSRGA